MCGICGKLNFDSKKIISPALIRSMADTIKHRGPDDEGYHISGALGLGFRRLSIIDLNTGHQPISNEQGTVWIVFNGEIYNYQELRTQLQAKGHVFRTQTDTEVVVHLYEEFGETCVEKLRGMFAFTIWDETRKTLFLARDRVGIKPLYYWMSDKCLIFGSEMKAILADPEVKVEVRPEMVGRFLALYFVPGEETLFRNIYKLAPGSCMMVTGGKARIRQYWDLQFVPTEQDFHEAEQKLLDLLEESVQLHMISDVPLGFLLSGGVDSTAMLSFAVGKADHPLRSFTLGFSAPGLVDERPYAQLAASQYGAEHYETTISAKQYADFLPKCAWHMEEPVCETSAIAMYYVSRVAKDFVKVLISGEGGDEAFAGYSCYRNYLWLERLKKSFYPLAGVISSGLSALNRVVRSSRLEKYSRLMRLPLESYYYSRISGPAAYLNTHADRLYSREFAKEVVKDFSLAPITRCFANIAASGTVNQMLYVDVKTSLPDDLLLRADKMTMANSIELRVPFLDHKVLEFAASMPEHFKVRGLTAKYVAKKAFINRLPKEIIDRKKVGFPVPFGSWFGSELKDLVGDVLLDREALARGYFNRSAIEALIKDNSESGAFSKEILALISLEFWHRAFLKKETVTLKPSLVDSSLLVGQP